MYLHIDTVYSEKETILIHHVHCTCTKYTTDVQCTRTEGELREWQKVNWLNQRPKYPQPNEHAPDTRGWTRGIGKGKGFYLVILFWGEHG